MHFYYIMGMLSAFDTGKSILNAVYITPAGTDYDVSSQWAKSVDNPKKEDGAVSTKNYSASTEDTIKEKIKSRITDKYNSTDITEAFYFILVLTVHFRSLAPWSKLFQLFI